MNDSEIKIRKANRKLIRPLRQIYCCKEILMGMQKMIPQSNEWRGIEDSLRKISKASDADPNILNKKVHFAEYKMIYDMMQVFLLEYLSLRIIAITKSVNKSLTLHDLLSAEESVDQDGPKEKLKKMIEKDIYQEGLLLWRNQLIGHIDPNPRVQSLKYNDVIELASEVIALYEEMQKLPMGKWLEPIVEDEGGTGSYYYGQLRSVAERFFSHEGKTDLFRIR